MRVLDPEIGSKWGRLIVTGVAKSRKGNKHFIVVCDCGSSREVLKHNLVRGRTSSCGCLQKELTSQRSETHGQTSTPAYNSWCAMKTRCLNPTALTNKRVDGFLLYPEPETKL